MIDIKKSIQKYRKPVILILLLQYVKFLFLILFAIDPPLLIVIPAGITPYGVIWYIVNWPLTLFLNEWLWKGWLLIIDTILIIFIYNKIGWKTFFLFQLFDILFFEQGLANLTVLWFAVLGFIDPIFIVMSIATKFPIGWWPIFDNPHVQYALANLHSGYYLNYDHLRVYSYILFWWLWPTLTWIQRRLSHNEMQYMQKEMPKEDAE
jgi:hypothetical protein